MPPFSVTRHAATRYKCFIFTHEILPAYSYFMSIDVDSLGTAKAMTDTLAQVS